MSFYHLEKGIFPTSNSPSAFSSYFLCFYCTQSLAELVSCFFVVWQAGSNKKYWCQVPNKGNPDCVTELSWRWKRAGGQWGLWCTLYIPQGKMLKGIHIEQVPRSFSQFIGKNTGCEYNVEVYKGWIFHGLYAVPYVLIRHILKNHPPSLVNVLMQSDSIWGSDLLCVYVSVWHTSWGFHVTKVYRSQTVEEHQHHHYSVKEEEK